jgi:glutathione synthase/RimK-type ligase-like ATP-grasp enzyme
MGQLLSYRVRRLFTDRPNPTFVAKPWHKIINWGNSQTHQLAGGGPQMVVNPFDAVRSASNKLVTFQKLENQDGIRIPAFTADRTVAEGWLRDGIGVVCRTVLSGHSGAGIVLCMDQSVPLANAPLYVQYVKKQREYRVHVAFGKVIDVQQKRQRSDYDGETNFQVRNHHTGWVYCREDIVKPDELEPMAVKTVARLGLDFGAVDIIWNEKRNECYVLEVNTAPGLEGTTVERYAQAFVEELA